MDCVLGIDFGTDSVRAVVFNALHGEAIATGTAQYPRWQRGDYCDAARHCFRQHPLDYLESLESAVGHALSSVRAGVADDIQALSICTTGSTPVAVDRDGQPLALSEEFKHNPNAMFFLWKDHSAAEAAEEINHFARNWGGTDFTQFSGGIYSSEWFWAKLVYAMRKDRAVQEATYSWVEHCDWIAAELSGNTNPETLRRSRCAAGHKAMWHERFEGLPAEAFLIALEPRLAGFRDRLYQATFTVDQPAGVLSHHWAERLGLKPGISIGVGALDAHMGAVGAGIRPNTLVKVIGTSSCDMLVAPGKEQDKNAIEGICGQVDGSILPGMLGLEAGQSAFGDVYAWFCDLLLWPSQLAGSSSASEQAEQLMSELTRQAAQLSVEDSDVVALDWLNGRRTPDANAAASGAITGLTLGTDPPRLFRALVEATAFGSRRIADHFSRSGIWVDDVIALGGVALKSPFVMQVLADVMGRTIKVSAADHACALGSAMCAAVVAGVHPDVEQAQEAMAAGVEAVYEPQAAEAAHYQARYQRYRALGEFVDA